MEFSWFLFLVLTFHLGRIYFIQTRFKKSDREAEEILKKTRKTELKKIFTEREKRIDNTEFDETRFWSVIDRVRVKNNNSYKKFNGLLRDEISSLKTDEIIQLDNFISRLFSERYSYDLLYASYIIFNRSDIDGINLLMSVLVSKGEVFFKNACINTDLLLGKFITNNEDDRILFDLTIEAYAIKTNKLIPIPTQKELVLKGIEIDENEIPNKYSSLWNEYFYNEI